METDYCEVWAHEHRTRLILSIPGPPPLLRQDLYRTHYGEQVSPELTDKRTSLGFP